MQLAPRLMDCRTSATSAIASGLHPVHRVGNECVPNLSGLLGPVSHPGSLRKPYGLPDPEADRGQSADQSMG